MALRAGRLFWWIESPDGAAEHFAAPAIDADWFYVLPLTALSNEKKARQLLLDPVFALLSGKPLEEALLRYPEICRLDWAKDQDMPVLVS